MLQLTWNTLYDLILQLIELKSKGRNHPVFLSKIYRNLHKRIYEISWGDVTPNNNLFETNTKHSGVSNRMNDFEIIMLSQGRADDFKKVAIFLFAKFHKQPFFLQLEFNATSALLLANRQIE